MIRPEHQCVVAPQDSVFSHEHGGAWEDPAQPFNTRPAYFTSGSAPRMDNTERILLQVNVATSLAVVQFLSNSLHPIMGRYDTAMMSLLVIQISFLYGHDSVLIRMSRRVSLLLLVEMLRPLLAPQLGVSLFTHIRSVMTNVGIVCIAALVPRAWRETSEGAVIVNAVIYLYSDMLDFLAEYRDVQMSMLVVFTMGLWFVSLEQRRTDTTYLWQMAMEIVAVTLMSVILTLLQPQGFATSDTRLIYLGLVITIVYAGSYFINVAATTQDYLVFAVAAEVELYVTSDWWIWALVLLAVLAAVRRWLGMRLWISQCALILWVDVIVKATLGYVQRLAVNDTIVTLKASALVIQFVLHELARRMHDDHTPF